MAKITTTEILFGAGWLLWMASVGTIFMMQMDWIEIQPAWVEFATYGYFAAGGLSLWIFGFASKVGSHRKSRGFEVIEGLDSEQKK